MTSDRIQLERMRRERDLAVERARQLEDLLCPPVVLPAALGLRPAEQRLLITLAHVEICKHDALLDVVRKSPHTVCENLVKVVLSKLKTKLRDPTKQAIVGGPFEVDKFYGVGYALRDRARWKAFMDRQKERAQPFKVAA